MPDLPERVCEGCDERFKPARSNQRTHGGKCTTLANNRRRAVAHEDRPCAICGDPFTPYSGGHKVCPKPACKREQYDRRRRKEKGAAAALADPPGPGYVGARAARPAHPKGWEPGLVWDGRSGTITSPATTEPAADWTDLLRRWGLDPEAVRIIEPVQIRSWDAAIGDGEVRTFYYYRASVESRGLPADDPTDVAALLDEIRRHKPPKSPPPGGDSAFVLAFADWQAGKADGDGLAGLVARVLATVDGAEARVRELRKAGRALGACYILGLGDLFESCEGHYPSQTFRVQLNNRDQRKVVRRLLAHAIKRLAPLFARVVVAGVGGNHGEERNASGKFYTDAGDNKDVAVIEDVAEALAENPDAYGHVSFVIPRDELAITLDACGTIIGVAHGHQARRSSADKIWLWWKDQAFGRQDAGDADLLITGHYHHLVVKENGRRTWIQCPALDGGSDWWEAMTGERTPAGTLSLVVGGGAWSDLQILARGVRAEVNA